MNENQRLTDDQEVNEQENEDNEENDDYGMIHHKYPTSSMKHTILNIIIPILIIVIIGLVGYHHYFLINSTKVSVSSSKDQEKHE